MYDDTDFSTHDHGREDQSIPMTGPAATGSTMGNKYEDKLNGCQPDNVPPGLEWLHQDRPAPAPVDQSPEPIITQTEQFLKLLDEDAERFTFQTFDDGKGKRRELVRVLHGTINQHKAELTTLNQAGAGIFVTINETDLSGRLAQNIVRVRAFFVDLDGAPLEPVMSGPLRPHIIVESGGAGRYHAYWLVSDAPIEHFTDVQKHLIKRFGADSVVHDLPRVMRLPGFWHRKAEPVMSRVIDDSGEQPYTFDEFIHAFGIDLSAPAPQAPAVAPVVRTEPGEVTPAVLAEVRKLAITLALKTHDDARIGRHGEIYKGGSYMRRDGLPLTAETATAFLKTFEENMRPTDTAGVICGLNWDAEMKTLNDGYYRPSERDRPGTTKAEAKAIAAGLAAANGMVIDPETGEILDGAGDEPTQRAPSKAFPLDGVEAEQVVAWAAKTGRKLPRREDWPRVWLDCGHHTAPFIGLMANCGSYDQFMPAVERYIQRREAEVERKNQERIAAGKEPAPDIVAEVIRLKGKEFLDRIMAMDVPDELGRELLRKLDANGDKRQIKLLSTHELDALPAQSYRIKHVLPATGLGAIWGPPGSGKTFLILDAAFAIAAGRQWFGHRVKQAPVVYCALEGEGGIQARVRAYRKRHGNDGMDNVRFLIERFNLRSEDDRQALVEAIKEVGFDNPVIVLDTLNRAAPGADENSSADMGTIIDGAKQIQDALGGLVVLVHHAGKNAAAGMRGHSSLLAALDVAIEVSREKDARKWTLAKSKDGADGKENDFSLDTVEIGIDEDGDPVTSCVVAGGGGDPEAEAEKLPKYKPLGKDAAALLKRIVLVTHKMGLPPGPFSVPEEIKSRPSKIVSWECVKSGFYDCDKSGYPTPTKNKAYHRAIDELTERNAICAHGDFVWVNPEINDMSITAVIMDANCTIHSAGIRPYGGPGIG